MTRANFRGFKGQTGASFCHYCNNQLMWVTGGTLSHVVLLTPGDRLPVRVHHQCEKRALKDGYRKETT